jgi:hypothetical protein
MKAESLKVVQAEPLREGLFAATPVAAASG